MIVGQNPGKEEDVAGVPFIGSSGRFLDGLLSRAGLDRTSLYITNAVKCHSAFNKEPELVEINSCKKYLREEIGLNKPKIILALGNTALKSLTGKSGVTKYRNEVSTLHPGYKFTIPVYSTFHPAAALRYPKYGDLILEDLKKFKAALEETWTEKEVEWEYWSPST